MYLVWYRSKTHQITIQHLKEYTFSKYIGFQFSLSMSWSNHNSLLPTNNFWVFLIIALIILHVASRSYFRTVQQGGDLRPRWQQQFWNKRKLFWQYYVSIEKRNIMYQYGWTLMSCKQYIQSQILYRSSHMWLCQQFVHC